MRPSGALMIEHRLIEKILPIIGKSIGEWEKGAALDPVFVDSVVDFFRTYADRTHHGKEEDILFLALRKKELAGENLRLMEELIKEHVHARRTVGAVVEANDRFRAGDAAAPADIIKYLKVLAGFYPGHMEKEDRVFFPEAMKYFDRAELEKMMGDFEKFDSLMIHEKYRKVMENFKNT